MDFVFMDLDPFNLKKKLGTAHDEATPGGVRSGEWE